jgi:signal peptidase I
VCIHYGNLYTRREGEPQFQIARKSPAKQQVLRMIVFDNRHQPADWPRDPIWRRWQEDEPGGWHSDDGLVFGSEERAAEAGEWATLAYRHLVRDWRGLQDLQDLVNPPPAQLITDFYAYNYNSDPKDPSPSRRWVPDLALSLRVEVLEARGKLRLQLVEAGDVFTCEFELATGECRLLRRRSGDATETVLDTVRSVIGRPGNYQVSFANVDDRLTLWVDKRLPFGEGHDYEGLVVTPDGADGQRPMAEDLRPARIAVQDARVRVSDLALYRDIYYTHSASGWEYPGAASTGSEQWWSNPDLWDAIRHSGPVKFGWLGPDDFMMMGDNSPCSKDGRLWDKGADSWALRVPRVGDHRVTDDELRKMVAERPGGDVVLAPYHVVRRQLLIGKAFFVYWPHAVPFGPYQTDIRLGRLGTFRVPFYPNVSRMKFIE